jgi:membrane-associated phospholipid phosphatase
MQHPPAQGDYALGLSWRVPDEVPGQQALLFDLLAELSGKGEVRANPEAAGRLRALLQTMAPTGRVPVSVADARWLQANPARDPVIRPGHTVVLPKRPNTVTVIDGDGRRCRVPHVEGREVADYLVSCGVRAVDWAWIAQADGRLQRYGVAIWNEQKQDEPAPGAWIWAPARNAGWPEWFSDRLIQFLSTQGPAPDGPAEASPRAATAAPPDTALKPQTPGGTSSPFPLSSLPSLSGERTSEESRPPVSEPGLRLPSRRSRDLVLTANDWGATGLLQTHTARTADAGHFAFSTNRTYPYVRGNIFTSPFDWLEAGVKYTNIVNRPYGPVEFSGSQAYKDKAFDAKVRIVKESAFVPQLAVGFQDIGGTGLFSGEYLVANKRTGSMDWSLGIGWGYPGGRANMRNPLSRLSSRFDARQANVAEGGNFSFGSYFRGPTALFGGVQYQTPWPSLIAKLEYDGNDYRHEPLGNNVPQRSPFNFGVVYRYSNSVDLTAAVERGNTLMVGLSLRTQLDGLSMPKVSDPAPIPVSPSRPQQPPNWAVTSADIKSRVDWHVKKIEQQGRELRLTVDDASGVYWRDLLDRVAAVLHRDAPASVDRFVIVYQRDGITDTQHVIDRDAWATPINQPLPPRERRDAVIARAADDRPAGLALYENARPRFQSGLGVNYQHVIGGPDHFYLYQWSVAGKATYRFRDDTWVTGTLQHSIVDNFDRYHFEGHSDLPRVRTFLREYYTSPGFKMPNLQATHVGRLSENQFFSVYGGYLEVMFAGVGAEWMYRPRASSVAYGIDINQVQQRGFKQDFELLDYRVNTGHATAYWDTGWNRVLAQVSVGRYLAGDIGATVEVGKVFQNGVSVGAFATKTNVSAAQFGEGSFDKGVYLRVPFDAILTRTSNSIGTFVYRPLTRDGGQKLGREVTLYDQTNLRDDRVLGFRPAPAPNQFRMPADREEGTAPKRFDPAPLTQVVPKPAADAVSDDFAARLEEGLYLRGYRNIGVKLEPSRTLDLRFSNGRLRPISRAVGQAARMASAVVPVDTRDMRIVFTEDGHPIVTYEFIDLPRLQEFFTGTLPRAELSRYVKVQYHNPSFIENDPLVDLGDMSGPTAVDGGSFPARASHPVDRVWEDTKQAGRTARDIDWLKSGAIGAGIIIGSSLLDKRSQRFAQDHGDSKWAKATTRFGDAIPLLAMAGAGAGILAASDPELSRSSYAAAEAGAAAFAAATALKYMTGRARPGEATSNRDFNAFSSEPKRDSFPSRHAAVAWAAITPFAMQYDAPWLYGLAAITQIGRVASGEHWFSDTVAGSLVGTAIGQIFYQSSKAPRGSATPRVLLSPKGVSLAWELN